VTVLVSEQYDPALPPAMVQVAVVFVLVAPEITSPLSPAHADVDMVSAGLDKTICAAQLIDSCRFSAVVLLSVAMVMRCVSCCVCLLYVCVL